MIWRNEYGTDYDLCKTRTDCSNHCPLFIGMWLKQSQTVNDKYIPLLLGGIGIVISAVYVFATCQCSNAQEIALAVFIAVTQGVLVAGLRPM